MAKIRYHVTENTNIREVATQTLSGYLFHGVSHNIIITNYYRVLDCSNYIKLDFSTLSPQEVFRYSFILVRDSTQIRAPLLPLSHHFFHFAQTTLSTRTKSLLKNEKQKTVYRASLGTLISTYKEKAVSEPLITWTNEQA